jgi:YfiH family protein
VPPLQPRYRFATRSDGDLRIDADPVTLAERRQRLVPLPWTWLHQVHGGDVVVVTRPGAQAGATADAAVTAVAGAALSVQTADCAPAALLAPAEGVVGIAHAGWKGLAGGVIEATVTAMRSLGANTITAAVGPCIGAECYEFAAADIEPLQARYGDGVRAETRSGAPALDLRAAVTSALRAAGVAGLAVDDRCTACTPSAFPSHRARRERARVASVVWLEP